MLNGLVLEGERAFEETQSASRRSRGSSADEVEPSMEMNAPL